MYQFQWILFDVSGVIIAPTLKNPNGYTVESRYFSQEQLEGMYAAKEYTNYMLGYISHEQFIGKYLKQHKLDLSVAEFDELFKKDIVPTGGMETLFQTLEKNYKIVLATNEGKMLTKYKVEGSDLIQYLYKVIPSYLLREIKPHPSFFKKTLKILGAQPDECIFIDDMKQNCDAASSLGIKSIQFKDVKQLEIELTALHIL